MIRCPVVVVTGASSGIGRACAESWARRAARLVLAGRDGERLGDTANQVRSLGGEAIEVRADLTQPDACRSLIQAAVAHYGRLDVLVCNAGVGLYGGVAQLDADQLAAVLMLNTVTPVRLVQLALPHLSAARGSIVLVSSVAGVVTLPRMGGYAASKFALEALADTLRAELAAERVPVHLLVARPGITATPFADNAHGDNLRVPRLLRRMVSMRASRVGEAIVVGVEEQKPEIDLSFSGRVLQRITSVSRPTSRVTLGVAAKLLKSRSRSGAPS